MKDKNEIQLAYTVWTLIAKLNDLIWDHYEEDFIIFTCTIFIFKCFCTRTGYN